MERLMRAVAAVICRVIDYADTNSINNGEAVHTAFVELGKALEEWEKGA